MTKKILSLIILSFITACSTATPRPGSLLNGADQAGNTSFKIEYSLGGHGKHQMIGSSKFGQNPRVASYLEREIIEKGDVQKQSYDRFVSKLVAFAKKKQRAPAGVCRSPYSVFLKIGGKTYTSKGCRDSDPGDFAKLVREGQFLLYSKK